MKQVKLQGSDRNSCRGLFPLLKTIYGYTLCLCMCILVTTTGFTHLLNIFCKVTNKGKVAIPISVYANFLRSFIIVFFIPTIIIVMAQDSFCMWKWNVSVHGGTSVYFDPPVPWPCPAWSDVDGVLHGGKRLWTPDVKEWSLFSTAATLTPFRTSLIWDTARRRHGLALFPGPVINPQHQSRAPHTWLR